MMRARLSPRGVIALGFDNGTTGGRDKANRPGKPGRPGGKGAKAGAAKSNRETPELGHALRSVYDKALNEEIPPEMLDLLGKLG